MPADRGTATERGTATARGTAYDHRQAGTPEAAWRADGRVWRAEPLEPPPGVRLVVVAAHPDDESLGAGGLMARVAAAGGTVEVVIATDGDASHPESPTHTPEQLVAIRRAEVVEALRRLGVRPPLLLALPDGRLADHVEPLTAALDDLLRGGPVWREVGPSGRAESGPPPATWLVAPWRGDRHPDHEAAGRAAAEVAARHGATLLEYPVWTWHWSTPADDVLPWERVRGVHLSAVELALKRSATDAHTSQVKPLSDAPGDEAIVPEHMAEHFQRDVEAFVVTGPVTGPVSGPVAGPASLPPAYFDRLYDESGPDAPWGLDRGWYERRKRALLLAALPRERYRTAVEPGCAVGLLTVELAERCDRVLALDVSREAVRRTRERVRGHAGVEVRVGALPEDWPSAGDPPELVVLSEVGYYLSLPDWEEAVRRVAGSLAPGGHVVACHWRHPAPDYPQSAASVHAALRRSPRLSLVAEYRDEDFLLDVLVAGHAVSVAREEGLLR